MYIDEKSSQSMQRDVFYTAREDYLFSYFRTPLFVCFIQNLLLFNSDVKIHISIINIFVRPARKRAVAGMMDSSNQ